MKAITLTAEDEAAKTHDLLALFKGLPEYSRRRIAADYPEIETVLNAGRQTFGTWRYFESSKGEAAAQSMINSAQARNLGKAARVILDEAELMGLGFSVEVNTKDNISDFGDTQTHHLNLRVKVKGHEAPPREKRLA